MPGLVKEIALNLRWPQRPGEAAVLVGESAELPVSAEAVVGSHAVKADTCYEALLQSGEDRILHVTGRLPAGDEPSFLTAEAWIRCDISEAGECNYELHVGPAGMDRRKACHKGRIALAVK